LIGIGWVVECVEKRERVEELNFLVDEPDPVVWDKKRRPMEPKAIHAPPINPGLAALAVLDQALGQSPATGEDSSTEDITLVASSSPAAPLKEGSLAPLERARRKSQLFAPKISSPLKTVFKPTEEEPEDC